MLERRDFELLSIVGFDSLHRRHALSNFLYTQTSSSLRSGQHTKSRVISRYKLFTPRRLSCGVHHRAGHTTSGRYTVTSKGRTLNYKYIRYNKYPVLSNYLIYGLWYTRVTRSSKLMATFVDITGRIYNLPVTQNYRPFSFNLVNIKYALLYNTYNVTVAGLLYTEQLLLLKQNIQFCCVAVTTCSRIIIARACGSYCTYIASNNDLVLNRIKVTLPSGKYKMICSDVPVTLGVVLGHMAPIVDTRGGFWRKFGVKPQVRGVVKNPVDHPHGGRSRAVHKPRSPWG